MLFGFAMITGGPEAAFANWTMIGGYEVLSPWTLIGPAYDCGADTPSASPSSYH